MAFLAFLENISPSWRNLTSPESFLLVLRTQIWHVLETRAYEKPREITKEHVWFLKTELKDKFSYFSLMRISNYRSHFCVLRPHWSIQLFAVAKMIKNINTNSNGDAEHPSHRPSIMNTSFFSKT